MARFLRMSLVSLFVTMLLVVSFAGGFVFRSLTPASVNADPLPAALASVAVGPVDRNGTFDTLFKAWNIIQSDFVGRKEIDTAKAVQGAIRGMIESLGDSHTVYLSADQLKAEREANTLAYEGIGASVRQDEQKRLIIVPMDGSPAKAAGMRNNDWIMAVNGQDITNTTIDEAIRLIRGPRGTKVKLTVMHDGDTKPVEIEVTRDRIQQSSTAARMTPEGYGYIRISVVTARTADELKNQIVELKKSNPKGIILDLRNNPGGVLDTTIDIVSQFLKDGVVLDEVNADGQKKTHRVRPGGLLTDLPMVILVNKNSASASEVISGALQDSGRAKVIGEQTFGKGTVNLMREIDGGASGAVYVSIARWYTPGGRLIEGKGITPDIPLSLTEEDARAGNDTQLQKAVEVLSSLR